MRFYLLLHKPAFQLGVAGFKKANMKIFLYKPYQMVKVNHKEEVAI